MFDRLTQQREEKDEAEKAEQQQDEAELFTSSCELPSASSASSVSSASSASSFPLAAELFSESAEKRRSPIQFVSVFAKCREQALLVDGAPLQIPLSQLEPEITNFTNKFQDCLDYIFTSVQSPSPFSAQTAEVYPELDRSRLVAGVGLPSAAWPSDHLAITATFISTTQPRRT